MVTDENSNIWSMQHETRDQRMVDMENLSVYNVQAIDNPSAHICYTSTHSARTHTHTAHTKQKQME